MDSKLRSLNVKPNLVAINFWPSDRTGFFLDLNSISQSELIEELLHERKKYYQLEALMSQPVQVYLQANPRRWFSGLKNKERSLCSLSKVQLIRELLFERIEYLAFAIEMCRYYDFPERPFPETA